MRNETELDFVRNKIKEKGFISASKIKIELLQRGNTPEQITEVLKSITGKGFHSMTYSNRYISECSTKVLYYYNPKKRNRKSKKEEK